MSTGSPIRSRASRRAAAMARMLSDEPPKVRCTDTYRVAPARKFRFAVQEHGVGAAADWRERARRAESLGYAALYLPDHFSDQLGPIAALMAAADATTT